MACQTVTATLDPMRMHTQLTIDGDSRAVVAVAVAVANTSRVEVGGV